MEEYKSNSNKSREAALAQNKKKIEKVVSGSTRAKKKSGIQKFADIFLPEDVGDIKSYIRETVIIPAIKKAISDTMDMLLYGKSGSRYKTGSASKVSYRSRYEKNRDYGDVPRTTRISDPDYDDIIFETRGDAEAVLDAMYDILGEFQTVSVADIYDLANMPPTNNYMLNRYGWADLTGATIVRIHDGYILKLPRAVPLN